MTIGAWARFRRDPLYDRYRFSGLQPAEGALVRLRSYYEGSIYDWTVTAVDELGLQDYGVSHRNLTQTAPTEEEEAAWMLSELSR
jgi:hypothetical protein